MRNVHIKYAPIHNEDHTTILVGTSSNTKLARILDDVTPEMGTILDVDRTGEETCKVKIDFDTHFLMKTFIRKFDPEFENDAERMMKKYEEEKEDAVF